MSAPQVPASMARAASIGLTVGLVLAGIFLMALSLRTLSSEGSCDGMGANECLLQRDMDQSFARFQFWMGLALGLLAVAGLLWIRSRDRKAQQPAGGPPPPP